MRGLNVHAQRAREPTIREWPASKVAAPNVIAVARTAPRLIESEFTACEQSPE